MSQSLECANGWQYCYVCNKEWFQQERRSSAPQQCKASYDQHNHGTLAEIQVGGSWSPSIQSRSLPAITPFLVPLKRPWRANNSPWTRMSSAELVHNTAQGFLWDSHSLAYVAVGQMPQQPRPIFLTYWYWFLLLGLWLVSFLMPLIYKYIL